jgi:hypothetical protein
MADQRAEVSEMQNADNVADILSNANFWTHRMRTLTPVGTRRDARRSLQALERASG